MASAAQFSKAYKDWVEDATTTECLKREAKYSQAIAVGTELYIEKLKHSLE